MLSESLTERHGDKTEVLAENILIALKIHPDLLIDDTSVDKRNILELMEYFVISIIENTHYLDESAYTWYHGICDEIGLTGLELYRRYLVKNILNKFRQDNGYATGAYIKMWDSVEDNVVALDIAEKLGDELNEQTLVNELNKAYLCIKGITNDPYIPGSIIDESGGIDK